MTASCAEVSSAAMSMNIAASSSRLIASLAARGRVPLAAGIQRGQQRTDMAEQMQRVGVGHRRAHRTHQVGFGRRAAARALGFRHETPHDATNWSRGTKYCFVRRRRRARVRSGTRSPGRPEPAP